MYYQNFFNAIVDLTGFTPLEGEMQELLDAAEKDRLISPESAEDFIKRHFNGIEKEVWFPALVALAEGYAKHINSTL